MEWKSMDETMKKLLQVAVCCVILLTCCERAKKSNSKRDVSTESKIYTEDSTRIISQLSGDLKNGRDFFSSREYFDSTQIIIDTIIYDPKCSKLAVFMMVKNPTRKQLIPDNRSDWYYNANLYLGIRKSQDSILLSSIGPALTNSIDRDELKALMRAQYFTIFGRLKDANGKLKYKYNLGEPQFWESSIWREIEKRELEKKSFEREGNEHPENIFEPKQKK